jgi:rhodanese-related sulfurtransferase
VSILKVRIKTIVLILLSVFTAATFCSCSEEKPPLEASVVRFFENFDKDAYRIGSEDFIYSVKANPDVFIIDLRKAEDYEAEHISYARNIPWGMDLWAFIDRVPQSRPILVYSYNKEESFMATALLALAGYSVKGVDAGWEEIALLESAKPMMTKGRERFHQVPPPDISEEVRLAIKRFFEEMDLLKDSMMDRYTVYPEDALFMYENKEEDKIFLCIDSENADPPPYFEQSILIPFGPGMHLQFENLPPLFLLVYGSDPLEASFAVVWLRFFGYYGVLIQS